MTEKLTWQQISEQYKGQWVQLIDCDWPQEAIDPVSGVVRVNAVNRGEFYDKLEQLPVVDGALLYVSDPSQKENLYRNTYCTISDK